ncbi:hypothetical protein [Variovorax sp. KK3]|uniref:hypothetical protein n=1 Tax=Variovorax sp. KK3 TaxID=1855728 RepID=UPI0015C2D2FE|nr:hypothetical protein [Variovorax sp. KK3]
MNLESNLEPKVLDAARALPIAEMNRPIPRINWTGLAALPTLTARDTAQPR